MSTGITNTCYFRLYSAGKKSRGLSFSVFDMISGTGTEPQKTKALAYMLSYCAEFRSVFVKYILKKWGETRSAGLSEKYNMFVWAERILGKKRADIVILPSNKDPQWIILIEAKDPEVRMRGPEIERQLDDYREELNKLYSDRPEIISVALTRDIVDLSGDYLSVSWGDILDKIYETKKLIHGQDKLFTEFLNFLTKYTMKIYEEDVLSIPAGRTAALIEKYGIYKCPESYNHKRALFLTFRKRGAEMYKLYPLKEVYLLEYDIDEDGLRDLVIPEKDKDAIAGYQKEEKEKVEKGELKRNKKHTGLHKFYVLDTKNTVKLHEKTRHNPDKIKGLTKHIYYRLCDILHPERCQCLSPSSQCE